MAINTEQDSEHHKNFTLVVMFIWLISLLFILLLFIVYNFSKKKVESEFILGKASILEESYKQFQDFFQNKLQEISYYNGYLDSATASKFVDTVLQKYSFVNKVIFYDTEVRNLKFEENGLNAGYFFIGVRNVYQFGRNIPKDSVKLFSSNMGKNLTFLGDFNALCLKLISFIQKMDTTKISRQADLFSVFTNIKSKQIDYLNAPQIEDLKSYKRMMYNKLRPYLVYQHDMFSFKLDPTKIKIKNTRPMLYQKISIVPINYDPLDVYEDYLTGELALGGPFSEYKLYFTSLKSFVKKEVLSYFFPVAGLLVLIYGLLVLVAYLIYRNLHINHKMFKLQYDFITNLTHEFKTPVSVIKIAGNNIKSAQNLTEAQKLYGKILDEEADKLNGLMNKILAFTQIENKSIKLNAETIDMENFIENTIEVYTIKYPDFKFTYEVNGFKNFVTDQILLGSLFDNLIENAYKYSPPNQKELSIIAERVKDKLVIRFIDRGIGIHSLEINNIFRKFYRIQNQYNQDGSVGLGLAFCKELVNFMGGEIFAKSTIGKETEFKVVLPYNGE